MKYRQPHQIHNALALWRGIQAAARYLRFCGFYATDAARILGNIQP